MFTNEAREMLYRLHCEEQHSAVRRQLALTIIDAHAAHPQDGRRALKAAFDLLEPSLEHLEPHERQLADVAKLWRAL